MLKSKKVVSLLLAMAMVLSIGCLSASAEFEYPSWTSVNPDGAKAVSRVNTDGTVTELPTFEEAYAYLDYESAPDDVKEFILEARRSIVYGENSWTVDGHVSIVHPDGTVEQLPEFKDLYPGWSLEQLSLKGDSNTTSAYTPQAANFAGNVDIPPVVSGQTGNEFYTFNSAHTYTDTWASSLPGDRINIGYRDVDANRELGYASNLQLGQHAQLQYVTGVRIAVRCSTYSTPGEGFLNVVGFN